MSRKRIEIELDAAGTHLARNVGAKVVAAQAVLRAEHAALGYRSEVIGAAPPTTAPSVPMTVRCTEPVPLAGEPLTMPDGSNTERVSCGRWRPCPVHDGASMTEVERHAEAHARLDAKEASILSAVSLIIRQIAVLDAECEHIVGIVHKTPRCSGVIDATCDNVPSPHYDPDTQTLVDDKMCDSCFARACRACLKRPAAPGRSGMDEACYRKEHRAKGKDAA